MNETTKTFKRLAKLAGFYPPILKKTHRGLVAKLALPRIEKYELDLFEKQCRPITFREPIRYTENGVFIKFLN
jgi:hypothetical protein